MALTTPDNIRTPNSGDQYALVQDLGVLADSVQAALNNVRQVDTGWTNVPLGPGLDGSARIRKIGVIAFLEVNCTTTFADGALNSNFLTVPVGFRPGSTISILGSYISGLFVGDLSTSGVIRLANQSGASRSGVRLGASWIASS